MVPQYQTADVYTTAAAFHPGSRFGNLINISVNITLRTHHRSFTLPIQTPVLNWGQLNTKGTDFSRIYMAFQIWSFGFKSFPLCNYSSNSWCKHCLAWWLHNGALSSLLQEKIQRFAHVSPSTLRSRALPQSLPAGPRVFATSTLWSKCQPRGLTRPGRFTAGFKWTQCAQLGPGAPRRSLVLGAATTRLRAPLGRALNPAPASGLSLPGRALTTGPARSQQQDRAVRVGKAALVALPSAPRQPLAPGTAIPRPGPGPRRPPEGPATPAAEPTSGRVWGGGAGLRWREDWAPPSSRPWLRINQ